MAIARIDVAIDSAKFNLMKWILFSAMVALTGLFVAIVKPI